jgi:hypothetical protein
MGCVVYGKNAWCGGSGSCVEGGGQGYGGVDDNEAKSNPVPSFTNALRTFEPMRAFTYAHDITKKDQVNIINIERSLFNFERKGAVWYLEVKNLSLLAPSLMPQATQKFSGCFTTDE